MYHLYGFTCYSMPFRARIATFRNVTLPKKRHKVTIIFWNLQILCAFFFKNLNFYIFLPQI